MSLLLTIVGPTASGKTSLAVAVARAIGGEIVSADSRQVYRGMDIGTGKDLEEYDGVPYHLIDICAAGERYNLYRYLHDCRATLSALAIRGVPAILCGGTGLYAESILRDYALPAVPANVPLRVALADMPLATLQNYLLTLRREHGKATPNIAAYSSPRRAIRAIEIECASAGENVAPSATPAPSLPARGPLFCLTLPVAVRRARITQRLIARMDAGLVAEVQGLLASGVPAETLISYGLEYKYVTEYCLGCLSYDEMFRTLETAIHRFAKRQMTWFRGMERRGLTVQWLDGTLPKATLVASIVGAISKK